ncbi:hypothetical protein GWC95_18985 [Sediminibacterium roseum]|uniref:KTSC domain-containing protein n=1 Tax=Sediminibacterium roseum TaxID=1978412 RepID=A0ABX0A241_9BACT|nr:hypothetical protein [Sediminibacterium roseum]NCI52017.1 hypothetical protein [Sediminibacterium roseum]
MAIDFSQYVVKMTTVADGKVLHKTEKGLLVEFKHNGVLFQHWFPEILTNYTDESVHSVPTFAFEEAIKSKSVS